ncbi:MAG TPA: DUF6069 family protein [Acidimicrobiia bacterium]|nr:DUF6069 family protein [Acidimicrobiia bacterium]
MRGDDGAEGGSYEREHGEHRDLDLHVAKAADVPLVAGDMEIQIPMFAVFTLIGAALGAVIATQLQERNGQPRRAFVITTVVLTALSFLPDITADATTATKLTLIGAHLVAAAVIVPALAARLTASRAA